MLLYIDNMEHKYINYLSYSTIILSFILMIILFFTILYPFEIVTLNKNPFSIVTPTVKRGDYVEYELHFTKHLNIKPKATYYLIDGMVIRLYGEGVSRQVGENIVKGKKTIPDSIPPGKYRIQIDLEYEIVPWRKLYYSWQSEIFEII